MSIKITTKLGSIIFNRSEQKEGRTRGRRGEVFKREIK